MTLEVEFHGVDEMNKRLQEATLLFHDFEGSVYLFRGGMLIKYRQTTLDEYM
jgi:hypothetical protein